MISRKWRESSEKHIDPWFIRVFPWINCSKRLRKILKKRYRKYYHQQKLQNDWFVNCVRVCVWVGGNVTQFDDVDFLKHCQRGKKKKKNMNKNYFKQSCELKFSVTVKKKKFWTQNTILFDVQFWKKRNIFINYIWGYIYRERENIYRSSLFLLVGSMYMDRCCCCCCFIGHIYDDY